MIKKLILFIIVIALSLYIGYYFGQQKPLSVTDTAKIVLQAFAQGDYKKVQSMTSKDGLNIDLYPRFNNANNVLKENISKIPTDTKARIWGYTDGKGDEINVTTKEFLDKFIFTHDYTNAPEIAINKQLGGGNSINHVLEDAGTDRTVVAFYFKGFDPKYIGMDWTTLYLIFDKEGNHYKLRAIAKDNWTI